MGTLSFFSAFTEIKIIIFQTVYTFFGTPVEFVAPASESLTKVELYRLLFLNVLANLSLTLLSFL